MMLPSTIGHRSRHKPLRNFFSLGATLILVAGCGDGGGSSGSVDTSNPVTTQGSSGAMFGVDLPPYQDLVLVSSMGTAAGLDGLVLSTVRQTPVMRFSDGTATRDLGSWINGQRLSVGSWQSNASGNVVFTFGTSTITSTAAPVVASRSPQDYFHCYDKVSAFSFEGVNALNSNTFCFGSGGAFSNSSSGSVADGGATFNGQSGSAGTYQVDGNVIRFTFNDGTQEVQLFGTYRNAANEVYAVSVGEAVLNKGSGTPPSTDGNPAVPPVDSTPGVSVPQNNSCTMNVLGCESSNYSCSSAEFCYMDQQACIQSNECGDGAPTTTPTPTTTSCTTNVEGCEPSNYSCDSAEFCYTDSESCIQANECESATGAAVNDNPFLNWGAASKSAVTNDLLNRRYRKY